MANELKETKAEINRLIQEIKATRNAEERREIAKQLREATRKLLLNISAKE